MMNKSKLTLLGALIGLARGTDSNMSGITSETDRAVINGLCALSPDVSDSIADEQTELVRKQKFLLVPDCAVCTAPCPRNADYNAAVLFSGSGVCHELKLSLLDRSIHLANELYHLSLTEAPDPKKAGILYDALFALGMDDWDEKLLTNYLQKFN